MIHVTPAMLTLLALGLVLIAVGASAGTWLIADRRTERWRHRALAAEDLVVRLRAQSHQRRQPPPRPEPVTVLPGLFDEADRVLSADAPTVVMRAATPHAQRLARRLDRRAEQ